MHIYYLAVQGAGLGKSLKIPDIDATEQGSRAQLLGEVRKEKVVLVFIRTVQL